MITSPQEIVIRNNTVINRFVTSDSLGSGLAESELDPDFMPIGSIVVDCRTTQGDHLPVWSRNGISYNETSRREFVTDYSAR